MVILGAVIITSAQESKTGKTFQQKKFNTEVILILLNILRFHPHSKPTLQKLKYYLFKNCRAIHSRKTIKVKMIFRKSSET
jgi:hypothetical protein